MTAEISEKEVAALTRRSEEQFDALRGDVSHLHTRMDNMNLDLNSFKLEMREFRDETRKNFAHVTTLLLQLVGKSAD